MRYRINKSIRHCACLFAIVLAADARATLDAQEPAVKRESASAPSEPATKPQSPTTANDSTTEPKALPTPKEEHKKQLVTVGMLLLVGVSLLGFVLIGMTIAWGGRLRRMARKPLPQQSQVDELWYLKAKKNGADTVANEGTDEVGPAPDRPDSP